MGAALGESKSMSIELYDHGTAGGYPPHPTDL